MRARGLILTGIGLAGLTGCDTFDTSLEKRIGEANTASEGMVLMLADSCSERLPMVESSPDPRQLPIDELNEDVAEAGQCSVSAKVLAGAEGFFQIEAKRGERWHFHLEAAPQEDLSVYVSDTCDLRECVGAADVCGVNQSEHFTFVPQTSGNFVVVVEGIDPRRTAPLKLTAINPVCGDKNKQHSEVCDDGNTKAGDGCDHVCRVELLERAAEEVEPNDDSFGANDLLSKRLPLTVIGKAAGNACQPDYYLIKPAASGMLSARVDGANGDPCDGAPKLELSVVGSDEDELRETIVRARSSADGDDECPVLPAVPVVKGEAYFIRLKALEVAEQFDYQLTVDIAE